jgi:hypothetical protein
MRPYTAYQLQVNEALAQALASVTAHADALAQRADEAAARADLDLAEVHAALSAQIRQLQSELANVPQHESASDGGRAASAARARRGLDRTPEEIRDRTLIVHGPPPIAHEDRAT